MPLLMTFCLSPILSIRIPIIAEVELSRIVVLRCVFL
jgi:hypothetical protein